MQIIVDFVSGIPNVIWSAIVASGLTFFGVFLTNKGNHKRQEQLLVYEREKYQSEQKLALKKEVFLSVASSFAEVLGIVPKLMNLEFTQKEIESQMEGHSGIVAKSYLVAKEESVAEILDYSAETAESLVNLMKERSVVLDHKRAIEIYQSTIDSANKEKDRIILIMREMDKPNHNDPVTFDYLNKSYEIQKNIVQTNEQSKQEQESILQPLFLSFAKRCVQEHARLLSLLPPMTIALRGELENDENPQVFIEALNRNIQRMKAVFSGLFDGAKT